VWNRADDLHSNRIHSAASPSESMRFVTASSSLHRTTICSTLTVHTGARGCPVDNVRRPSPSSVTNGAGFVTDGTWPSDKPAQGPSLDTRRGWGHDVSVPRLRVFVGFLQVGDRI
jgi:hypothetical protein